MKFKKKYRQEAVSHLLDTIDGINHIINLINNDKEINNEDWQRAAISMNEYINIINKNNGSN